MELQKKNEDKQEMKIKNQDIKIDQQEIEELDKEATIQEKENKTEENQQPTKIDIKILPKLKEKYVKNKIKIKNKKIQDKSCLTVEAKIKNKFKLINYFKKKGKIFMVSQQECVGTEVK